MRRGTFKIFVISILLLFTIQKSNAQWTQIGQNINGETADEHFGQSIDLTPDGQYMVVGAYKNANNGTNAGQVRIFKYISNTWTQIGSSIDGQAGDYFGVSVAISNDGSTIIAGANRNQGEATDAGAARVYHYNGTDWVQKGSDIEGTEDYEYRGNSVDISGDGSIIAVADYGHHIGIITYQFDGTNWVQLANTVYNGSYDCKIKLSDDASTYITTYTNYNFVAIYRLISGSWTKIGDFISGDESGDRFGESVAITPTGSTIVVGATLNDSVGTNAGQVKVFDYDGTDWVQRGSDIFGTDAGNIFGASVDITDNGNTIIASATNYSGVMPEGGQVRVFSYDGSNWVQKFNTIQGSGNGDYLGNSVAISAGGDTIAIGVAKNDDVDTDAGKVLVFSHCSTLSTINEVACDSYTSPSGNYIWTTSGVYNDTIPNSSGCDSIITINLTINQSDNITDTHTACDSYTWIDGITYTVSNNTATYTLTNVNGCDSIITLDLTINNSNTGVDTQIACDSFNWIDGITYTESNNTATYTLTNIEGCDSIVTLNLTINHPDYTTDVQIACDSYTWIDGNTYISDNNTAVFDTVNMNGCDSVITLDLTINHSTKQWLQVNNELLGASSGDKLGSVVTFNSNGNIMATSSPYNNDFGSGIVQVFTDSNGTWQQKGQNIYVNTTNENFGTDISLNADGNIIVIGSYNYSDQVSNGGVVRVYKCVNNTWQQIGDDIYGTQANEQLGNSVDINADGNIIVIGSPKKSDNGSYSGQVKVYENISGTWTQIGSNINGDNSFDYFGYSVAVNYSGDIITAGAFSYDNLGESNNGQVKVFQNNSGVWTQLGTSIIGQEGEKFGTAVDMDSTGIFFIASGPYNDGTNYYYGGKVREYRYNGTNWYFQGAGMLSAPENEYAIASISLSADASIIAVGISESGENGENSGKALVYEKDENLNWLLKGNVTYGTTGMDNTGNDICINNSGSRIVVGTYKSSSNGSNSGKVNVYEFYMPTDVVSACNTYTWIDGVTYTESNNTATYVLTNTNGCDSVVALNLTINNVSANVTQNNDTLIAELQTGATYQWLDCNSNYSEISGADTTMFIPSTTGDYAVEVSLNSCTDTSICYNVVITDLIEFENSVIELYPNPAKQYVNIIIPNSLNVKTISVFNLLGEKVYYSTEINKTNLIDVSKFTNGTYFINIETIDNKVTKKLIIN